ncbi:MAG: protocatechuate 3,4-dioxygenase subunit beta [Actinomycetota bacterium]|nr:protocatechuate 3,4-dioxygenase subunit beta [Actinomycetota bacterium]
MNERRADTDQLPVARPDIGSTGGTHPPLLSPDYVSTRTRAPMRPPVPLAPGATELTGPVLGERRVTAADADLTRDAHGEAVGQRILVAGTVRDEDGRPLRNSLVEIWQANSAGRYRHNGDRWPAPLDPHFSGLGRAVTDEDGSYSFLTVRPGAYPWRNHHNAWRPAHIHFSLFGRAFVQRLVTQMYFPDDPLLALDPIYNSVPAGARPRLVSRYDHGLTQPEWALGYRFDIVLRGAQGTPFEDVEEDDE